MQITGVSPAYTRPQATPKEQAPTAEQEIKRLVTRVKVAEVGARVAPETRAEAAAQEIRRIATMVTAAMAGAPVDPGRSAADRASLGYSASAQTASEPQTARLMMSA